MSEAEAALAAATAELADQSWLRGTTVVTASAGVATFTDLTVSKANSYPPGYPDPAAGARGAFLLQFTAGNQVGVAGARPTPPPQPHAGCEAPTLGDDTLFLAFPARASA